MTDIVDKKTRSRMMSRILGRDTKPEMVVRSGLHQLGFRFRLHVKGLPGRPDLVLPRWKTAVFVNGCFWHCHGCELFRWPKTNHEFWKTKLTANRDRDRKAIHRLVGDDWYVAIIWECAIRHRKSIQIERMFSSLSNWISKKSGRRRIQEFR